MKSSARPKQFRMYRRVSLFSRCMIGLPLGFSCLVLYQTQNSLPLAIYLGMGAVTFGLYSSDKKRAELGQWRIAESTLHLVALLGGWAGGLFAQQWLRHKTQKRSFQRVFWLIVSSHLLMWTDWLLFHQQMSLRLFAKLSGFFLTQ